MGMEMDAMTVAKGATVFWDLWDVRWVNLQDRQQALIVSSHEAVKSVNLLCVVKRYRAENGDLEKVKAILANHRAFPWFAQLSVVSEKPSHRMTALEMAKQWERQWAAPANR